MKKQIGLLVAGGVILTATLIFLYQPGYREAVPFPGNSVRITVPLTYQQDHRVLVGAETVSADALQERIRQTIKPTDQKGVLLSADRGVRPDEVMEVMDALTASGVVDRIQLAHPD